MKVLLDEGIIELVKQKEALFRSLLVHSKIKSVRSFGLWMAVEFDSFETNKKIIDSCLEASGRFQRPDAVMTDWFLFAPNSLRISPPLTISEKEIKKACESILQALNK
jgi:acetylornithine/succinyldiaminopimelate/putrescine aminotransferase